MTLASKFLRDHRAVTMHVRPSLLLSIMAAFCSTPKLFGLPIVRFPWCSSFQPLMISKTGEVQCFHYSTVENIIVHVAQNGKDEC